MKACCLGHFRIQVITIRNIYVTYRPAAVTNQMVVQISAGVISVCAGNTNVSDLSQLGKKI